MNRQLQLDHATVCGPALEPMRKAFAAAGLATEYGGPHANGITHMAMLGFPDGSYLELIAPQEAGITWGSHWNQLMTDNAGAGAWAVGVDEIQAEIAHLRGQQIEVQGPFPGSRRRPDGKVLKWEIAAVGPGEPGALLPFMIQDHTPREWRVQPSASVKESGLSGIVAIVLGVTDLGSAAALFRRAYGWGAPEVEKQVEFDAEVAHFPNTPVTLATPSNEDSWLASRLEKFGDGPTAFLLGARDVSTVAHRFQLSRSERWFGRDLAWFDPEKLQGAKLGVIGA